MSMKALNIAQIAIFGPLLTPAATYCLFRHGKSGLLGWIFVLSFCLVRTLGAVLQYRDEENNTVTIAAQVVSNLGVPPLILASAGLIHEARWNFSDPSTAPGRKIKSLVKALFIIQFHTFVAVGITLIIMHATDLKDALTTGKVPSGDSSSFKLVKIGFAILVIAWVILTLWTLASWRPLPTGSHSEKSLQRFGNQAMVIERDVHYYQRKLLAAVTVTIPFIALPVCFSMYCYGQENFAPLNEVGYKAGLSVAPQMIVGVIWMVAGLYTRNMRRSGKMLA